MKIRPVILSGGSGTRLWPVSRRCFPKQFAPLLEGPSLFVRAVELTSDRRLFEPPLIVGNAEHKFLILDALENSHSKDATVILEPAGRNTAAAALSAALWEQDPSVLHLVMPSDHVMSDRDAFIDMVYRAKDAALNGALVAFGLEPTRPDAGLGYIMPGDATAFGQVTKIAKFYEKPSTEVAAALIAEGALWNAGVFLFRPLSLINEAERLAPGYGVLCKEALDQAQPDIGCLMLGKEPYARLRAESFDRLIMEKTSQGYVLASTMRVADAGSWHSVWEISVRNPDGNCLLGPVVAKDVSASYIRSDGPMVAVIGLNDLTVVATRDAVLIAPRDRSQDVRDLAPAIERTAPMTATHHTLVARPWGSYEKLAHGDNFQVKHIVVQPGRALSLQKHHHRAEHWVVVGGTAKVERDGVVETIFPNESVFVARGTTHRLSNPGKIPLHLIEVQSGDYLGEDDIIRLDEPYGSPQWVDLDDQNPLVAKAARQ